MAHAPIRWNGHTQSSRKRQLLQFWKAKLRPSCARGVRAHRASRTTRRKPTRMPPRRRPTLARPGDMSPRHHTLNMARGSTKWHLAKLRPSCARGVRAHRASRTTRRKPTRMPSRRRPTLARPGDMSPRHHALNMARGTAQNGIWPS